MEFVCSHPPLQSEVRDVRTLLLAPELFTSNGGIPRILRLYAKALSEPAHPGDTFAFLSLGDHEADSNDLRRHTGANLSNWAVSNGHRGRFIRRALRWSRRHDHVICGHIHLLPVAGAMRLLNPRLSYDLIAHGIEVWGKPSLLQGAALRGCRRILCVSDYTRTRILSHSPGLADKAIVVHNGLDCHFSIPEQVAEPPSPPLILSVSRLCKSDSYKGIDILIQAMPAVRAKVPTARLRIIGKGDDARRLRRCADQLGLGAEVVEMPGHVSDAELARSFAECSLFALPSTGEGFGLVFIEAMAQGRPCVGVRAGGVPEVISPESGLLAEPGQPQALADILVATLNRPWDRSAILSRARQFSYGNFRAWLHAALPSGPRP